MNTTITNDEIFRAVQQAQSEIHRADPENWSQLINTISNISVKAVFDILNKPNGKAVIIDDTEFPVVIQEWAQQFALKSHTDRFLAIMWYLREREDTHAVTINDIAAMYDRARWAKPANLADVLNKASKRVFFAEAEEQSSDGLKLWQITRTGYDYLMNLKVEV